MTSSLDLPLAHVGGPVHPAQSVLLTLGMLAYWRRTRTLAAEGHPVPLVRQLLFLAGIALAIISLVSPIADLGEKLLWVHMVQHLLLGDVAALLIVIGLTGPVLRPVLAIGPIYRLRFLTHPLVAFPLWAVNLFFWHMPALYQGAVENPVLHALEHVCFFSFGVLMWMALLGPLPRPAWFGNFGRLVYVLAVRAAGAALANVLLFAGVLYPTYASTERDWGISAATDQQVAGGVMLAEGSLLTLGLLAWLLARAIRDGEEAQSLIDLAEAHGVPLGRERARRAVAGGWSAALRGRITSRAAAGGRDAQGSE